MDVPVYLSVHPFTKKPYYEFLCYSKLAGSGSVLFKLADWYSHTAHQRILAGEAETRPMTVLLVMPDTNTKINILSSFHSNNNESSLDLNEISSVNSKYRCSNVNLKLLCFLVPSMICIRQ